MNNENKKIITVSQALGGILVAFVVGLLLDTFSGYWGALARAMTNTAVRHGLPLAVGALTFFVLYLNKSVFAFCDEVVTELRKVVWPSRRDTMAMTMVVCILVVFFGIFFGVFDLVSSYLLDILIRS